jgi:hypothetical protein
MHATLLRIAIAIPVVLPTKKEQKSGFRHDTQREMQFFSPAVLPLKALN